MIQPKIRGEQNVNAVREACSRLGGEFNVSDHSDLFSYCLFREKLDVDKAIGVLSAMLSKDFKNALNGLLSDLGEFEATLGLLDGTEVRLQCGKVSGAVGCTLYAERFKYFETGRDVENVYPDPVEDYVELFSGKVVIITVAKACNREPGPGGRLCTHARAYVRIRRDITKDQARITVGETLESISSLLSNPKNFYKSRR